MMSEQVTFRIKRFNPEEAEKGAYWEDFEIDVVKGKTLLEGFFDIMETMDGSLTFRFGYSGNFMAFVAKLDPIVIK